MALNVFELFGKIVVDNSGAEKGIDKTVRRAKDAERNLSRTFKKIGSMVAAAFSVKAVVDFGKQCTEVYASIAAEESAFAQIMGEYADTAQEKLDAVSDATGISSTRMTSAMTSLTAKFKGLGYGVEDATTLATDGLLIAADAAAFWDMSLEESTSHLNSFINGSYEGGEAIGLFANDTQMAAFAIEQGIVKDAKAWAKLDEAQKQATRLLYAKRMMETSGATGQAAKEADQYANVMANLKEHWRQFQGIIGEPILEKIVLPAMQKLNEIMPILNDAVRGAIALLDEVSGKAKDFFNETFSVNPEDVDGMNTAQRIIYWWENKVKPQFDGVFEETFGVKPEDADGTEVGKKLRDWFELCKAAYGDVFQETFHVDPGDGYEVGKSIREMMDTAYDTIGDAFTKLFTVVPKDIDAKETAATLYGWWKKVEEIAGLNVLRGFFGVDPDEDALTTANRLVKWGESVLKNIGDMFKGFFGVEPKEDAETTATGIGAWWADVTKGLGESMFDFVAGFKLPSIEEVVTAIKEWWADVTEDISLKLSIAFPNLFGSGTSDDEGKEDPWANWKPFESSFSLPDDNSNTTTYPEGIFNPLPDWITFEPAGTGGSNGNGNLIGALLQQLSTLKTDVIAATKEGVSEGLSGVTITADVSTGNVTLDGKTVGKTLAPYINFRLGQALNG